MIEIVDTPQDVTRYLPRMPDVHTIIRYITRGAPGGSKHVKLPEVRAIKAAGKKLAIVHETWGDFAHANHGGISALDGRADGEYSRRIMPRLGAPQGACVYFAVDTDPTPAQLRDNVLPYFRAVWKAFQDREYTVGVYGPGQVCQAVLDAGLADYFWLANAKGWKGYKAFKPQAHLVQLLPTHIAGNLDVDPNVAQVEDWGQFVPFSQDAEIFDGKPLTFTATDDIPAENDAPPPRLGAGDNSSAMDTVTNLAGVAGAGGLLAKVKPLFRSKLSWLAGGMGTSGAATAVSSDPQASSLAGQLLVRPSFWLGLAFVAMAGIAIYFYWRDHGKGALR